MYSIPDHSTELNRLRRLAWWGRVGATIAVVSILALLASLPFKSASGLPSEVTGILICFVIPPALLFYVITYTLSANARVSTDLEVLEHYEEFRRLYDIFRHTPSTRSGDLLYSYYYSFRSRRTKEDKLMAEAINRCTPTLIKLGVIHT